MAYPKLELFATTPPQLKFIKSAFDAVAERKLADTTKVMTSTLLVCGKIYMLPSTLNFYRIKSQNCVIIVIS